MSVTKTKLSHDDVAYYTMKGFLAEHPADPKHSVNLVLSPTVDGEFFVGPRDEVLAEIKNVEQVARLQGRPSFRHDVKRSPR